MSSAPQLYEVVEGVRRAKAFQLCGIEFIQAEMLNPDGSRGAEFLVRIEDLRSPYKSAIEMIKTAHKDRFFRIFNAVHAGRTAGLPPIVVEAGSRGVRIEDIGWIY